MAIAGTTWNPDVGEIIEEAFELCGKTLRSGQDMVTARRSINYLTLEWANAGLNLWTVDAVSIASSTVTAGTATYAVDTDTISILDMVVRTDDGDTSLQNDILLNRIATTTYAKIPNKLQSGRPTQWASNRGNVQDS